MGAIVQTIGNGINAIGSWLGTIVGAVWNAILLLLDGILAVVVQLAGWVLLGVVGLLGFLLQLLIGLMPDMPVADDAGAYSGFSSLSAANQYVPIAEAFALLPVLGAIAAGIGVYKFIKFVRGGG